MSHPTEAEYFSFRDRPVPVPGDLRIGWRVPVLIFSLYASRGKKASLAKLYVLSQAVQSPSSQDLLNSIASRETPANQWRVRVEPALGRAVDLLVGDKLASWLTIANRTGVQLTQQGISAGDALSEQSDSLEMEKAALRHFGQVITEALVSQIISRG